MGSMGLILPTEDGDNGVWDTKTNTALSAIEEHDHTSGNGVRVPVAGLNINANLPMGGFSLTGLASAVFSAIATAVAANLSLFVNSADSELYWKTSGGTAVKLTNGSGLNTTLVGGITGDYSSTDADVEYVDSAKAYEFKQDESPNHWANVRAGTVYVYEPTSGITKPVGLKSPTSLANAYDITLPAALPGSTELLTMTSAGVVDHTLTPSVTTITTTGNAVIGGDANVTGNVKHATITHYFPASLGQTHTGTPWTFTGNWTNTSDAGIFVDFPIMVPAGRRLRSVSYLVSGTGAGASMIATLYRVTATGTVNVIATNTTTVSAANQEISVFSGTQAIAANEFVYLRVEKDTGAGVSISLLGGSFGYDYV